MAIALILFLLGSKYYTRNMPTGNIFAQFLGATWAALRGKCKGNHNCQLCYYFWNHFKPPKAIKEHISWIMQRTVENIQLKSSMMPNGFSLFSSCTFQFQCFGHFLICKVCNFLTLPNWKKPSSGSRWTQTATQMNGYLGSVQILPDQIQLLNSLMILLFLPIFQKLIYPAFEWCGVTVSPLRKMSLGQVHHLFGLMFG